MVLTGGGKWRYIAITNWLTNSVLWTVHSLVFSYLRSLDSDCTFYQDRVKPWASKIKSQGKEIFSYDLKSATDRLPIQIQAVALRHLVGREVAAAWLDLMTTITFHVQVPNHKGVIPCIKYATGQGMGLYSS